MIVYFIDSLLKTVDLLTERFQHFREARFAGIQKSLALAINNFIGDVFKQCLLLRLVLLKTFNFLQMCVFTFVLCSNYRCVLGSQFGNRFSQLLLLTRMRRSVLFLFLQPPFD